MDYIAENIRQIRAQMEEAALRAGRDPKEILLCAATKMNPAEAVRAAIAGGVETGCRNSRKKPHRMPIAARRFTLSAIFKKTKLNWW